MVPPTAELTTPPRGANLQASQPDHLSTRADARSLVAKSLTGSTPEGFLGLL